MKYCSKCKKIYPDDVVCKCVNEKYSWEKEIPMVEVDIETVCKCGSTDTEGMLYHPPYKYISCDRTDPAYCRCAKCEQELLNHIAREESMKYYIMDDYKSEYVFCDDSDEVDEYLKDNHSDHDRDSGPLDEIVILKLEPYSKSLTPEDFKSPRNTHLVILDNEIYRVEEVIVPEIEFDGGCTINW